MKEKIKVFLVLVIILSALGITGTVEYEKIFPTEKVIFLTTIMFAAIIAIAFIHLIKRREE